MPPSDQSEPISWRLGADFPQSRPHALYVSAVFGALLVCLACSQTKESSACLSSRDRAREAATQGQLDQASKRLEEARAQCSSKSHYDIRRTEKLVAEKLELQRDSDHREKELREQIEKAPAKRFVTWVTEKRDAVSNNVSDVNCAERGSREFGFCEGTHPGSAEMTVRYWEAQKGAFRYAFSTNAPLSCVDLGDHRRVRSWSREQTSYDLCELTEHELRSLSALLVRTPPAATTMYVFSHAYVQKDRSFERLLQGKPELTP